MLLILRERMLGPQRFTDLRHALPGIAPNLLSERLRTLEDAGLVARTVLEPPAARTVYIVTARGETRPGLDSLAQYGRVGSLRPRPTVAHGPTSRTMVHHRLPHARPSGQPFRARVRLDGSPLDIVVVGHDVSLTSSSDSTADLELDLAVEELVAARRGEPLRLPPGSAGERFAHLFQFETGTPPA